MKQSKILIYVILQLLLIALTGCYNKNELDNLAYVVGLGADVGSGENLEITYQIAVPLKISSNEGKTGKENFITYTVSAPSLYVANSKVNAITSKEVNLSHVKIIVYSEELAKNDLEGHINSLVSNPSIRPRTTVAICKNKAKDFLENVSPDLESSPARYYELLFTAHEYTAESSPSELLEFFASTTSVDKDAALLLLSNDASNTNKSQKEASTPKKVEGLAIFSGSKMVGEIPSNKILPHLILKDELKTGEILVNDVLEKEKIVSISLKQSTSPNIKVTFEKQKPQVEIRIKLSGKLQSSSSTTNYLNEVNKEKLVKNAKEAVKNEILSYLKTTQKLGSDTIGIGKYARKNFLTWNEFEENNWKEKYKNAEIHVYIDLELDISKLMYHRLPTN